MSENINFYGGIYGLVGQRLTERSAWAIHMAGLQGRENQFTRLLTGGWKQRLALACAILHRPPITFIVPARYFIALLRGIFLKGIGLEVLGLNAALLTLYAAVMMILAHRKMKLKLEG